MNKKAIQLSINFIVMFILAMAMFGMGITITYKIFNQANELKSSLTESQKSQLENMLKNSPQKVSTLYSTKTLKPKEDDVFGIGIRNDNPDTNSNTFQLYIEWVLQTDKDDATICDSFDTCRSRDQKVKLIRGDKQPITIERQKHHIEELFVFVDKDAQKGTYIFNVKVCNNAICDANSDTYGNVKQLTVIVK